MDINTPDGVELFGVKRNKMANWIVETGINEEYESQLISEIKHQGHSCLDITYKPFLKVGELLTEIGGHFWDNNTIFVGSIPTTHKLRYSTSWKGVYYSPDEYQCHNYYMYYGDKLLNWDHLMLPFGDIKYRFSRLLDYFNGINNYTCQVIENKELFIRPDNGNKHFTAGVFTENTFKQTQALYTELCLVSKPHQIASEWRFVVSSDRIISSSRYLPEWRSGSPTEVQNFVDSLLTRQPVSDTIYCLDVARLSTGELKVMEINAFSCSCLYECDLSMIVEEVSRITEEN